MYLSRGFRSASAEMGETLSYRVGPATSARAGWEVSSQKISCWRTGDYSSPARSVWKRSDCCESVSPVGNAVRISIYCAERKTAARYSSRIERQGSNSKLARQQLTPVKAKRESAGRFAAIEGSFVGGKYVTRMAQHCLVVRHPLEEEKILHGVRGLFAEYERVKIAERFRIGKRRRVREGHILTCEGPYGLTYVLMKDRKHGSCS